MTRRIRFTLAAALAATALGVAAPAEATRFVVPEDAPDRCWNLEGVQPLWQIGQYAYPTTRFYRFKVRTPEQGDCRWTRRGKVGR